MRIRWNVFDDEQPKEIWQCSYKSLDGRRCWGTVAPRLDIFDKKGKPVGHAVACDGHADEIEGGDYISPPPETEKNEYEESTDTTGLEVPATDDSHE